MIIVFEGPDNTGKSTAAIALCEMIRGTYIKHHRKYPSPGSAQLLYKGIGMMEFYSHVVMDRHPTVSEHIYGKAIRGTSKTRTEHCLEDLQDCVFIHCIPPANEMRKWGDRDQMEGVKENIQLIADMYYELADYILNDPRIGYVQFDYTRHTIEDLVVMIDRCSN